MNTRITTMFAFALACTAFGCKNDQSTNPPDGPYNPNDGEPNDPVMQGTPDDEVLDDGMGDDDMIDDDTPGEEAVEEMDGDPDDTIQEPGDVDDEL